MNGIIHTAARLEDPEEGYPPEEIVFLEIFRYLEILFDIVKPEKVFYLAIDGLLYFTLLCFTFQLLFLLPPLLENIFLIEKK